MRFAIDDEVSNLQRSKNVSGKKHQSVKNIKRLKFGRVTHLEKRPPDTPHSAKTSTVFQVHSHRGNLRLGLYSILTFGWRSSRKLSRPGHLPSSDPSETITWVETSSKTHDGYCIVYIYIYVIYYINICYIIYIYVCI